MKKTGSPHGAICRTLRTLRGLTQAQVGGLAGDGIDGPAISRLESSGNSVTLAKLVRVLSALGADLVVRDREFGIDMYLMGYMYPPKINKQTSYRMKEWHRNGRRNDT